MIDSAVLIITLGSLCAAFVNAAFATGGVYVLLLTSIWVLPISAAVPLQSAFAAASLISRVGFFWQHIQWGIVRAFVLGSTVGAYLGTRTFVTMPEDLIRLLLGLVLLALIWMPRMPRAPRIRHPFVYIGVVHSYLGSVFGVGGVLQPVLLRTEMRKLQITGTLAACMLTLDVFKAIGYTTFGFSYLDYVPHIIGATVAGFIGTWLGKRTTHLVSETLFRQVFRVFVTLVALRMIYAGLT